ncbi:MAG: 6-phosphofructokinase, partial [Bdellovibrionales bacterium]|nr:6-phosphofructokinase [Bdellovibrionales bacterium]
DIAGTDVTIGFDTAVNTALEAIDRIRDTAASHDRLFIVEVMGRNSGFIAVDVGVAGGAEAVFTPESPLPVESAVEKIQAGLKAGKGSSILIAAEGQKPGRAYDLAEAIRKKSGFEAKVCILGHIQRGGAPSAADRILGSRMGVHAVELLHQGKTDVMVGIRCGQIVEQEMSLCLGQTKPLPPGVMDLVDRLR